ncbi:MAG: GNAT family N-acetyltransferase [Phycisphaerae bacterium]|nr:GNAT family N-acetyltransferase [Phycisphaerae bacterium]
MRYTESLDGVTADMLAGFFEGWLVPPSPQRHLRILRGSTYVVLAVDDAQGRVVGFINAITDACNSAFIPLLEVLPAYRRQSIARELVARMLQKLADYPCIDLTCDTALQGFYEKFGMRRATAMIVREYSRPGPRGAGS